MADTIDDFDIPLSEDASPPTPAGSSGSSDSPGSASSGADPEGAAVDGAATQTQESALPPWLATTMQQEGLRTIPGEAPEATQARVNAHLVRKNAAYYHDMARAREAHAREIAALRQSLEPIVREHYQRERLASLEEQSAQIPPKGTPEYAEWLQEETLRRMDERERLEQEQMTEAERVEHQRQIDEHYARVDAAGYAKVAEGLGLSPGSQADPEFATAYNIYSEAGVEAALTYFPTATDAEIQEFIATSQRLDVQRAELSGQDIRQVYKQRFNALVESLVRAGVVQRVGAQAQATAAGANGNGNGQPQQSQQSPRQPVAPQRTTAQQVAADSQAAARRGPSAVASTARPTGLPGQFPDIAGMEEDDYVEAAISNLLGNEEQRTAQYRKQR